MQMITAAIQHAKLESISPELIAVNILDMTVTTCSGHGRDAALVASFRGGPDLPDLLPMILLEVMVPGYKVKQAVEAIVRGARSGPCGAGKIFVKNLARVVRIDTGEDVSEPTIKRTRIRRTKTHVIHATL